MFPAAACERPPSRWRRVRFSSIDGQGAYEPVSQAIFIVHAYNPNQSHSRRSCAGRVPRAGISPQPGPRANSRSVRRTLHANRCSPCWRCPSRLSSLRLAGVERYGVLRYFGSQRLREIGDRMAAGRQAGVIAPRAPTPSQAAGHSATAPAPRSTLRTALTIPDGARPR
jgi:hypothetical protein